MDHLSPKYSSRLTTGIRGEESKSMSRGYYAVSEGTTLLWRVLRSS